MNYDSKLDTPSNLIPPLFRLIIFRFLNITPSSNNLLKISWRAVEGASSYTVQLVGVQGIIWRDTVIATDASKINYSNETPLQQQESYLLTVEVDKGKSYVEDYKVTNAEEIERYTDLCKKNISQAGWKSEFRASIESKLDYLLRCRDEIIQTLQTLIAHQTSQTEILYFVFYCLQQASVLKSLADHCSADEILQALDEFASQIAAADVTLADYYAISGESESLVVERFSKAVELVLPTQPSETLETESLAMRSASSAACPSYCDALCRSQWGYLCCQPSSPCYPCYCTST
jgi:hypothetical protein